MVYQTLILLAKQPLARVKKTSFLDRLRLCVAGGPGGTGYPKINGVGGNGGNVYIEVSEQTSLANVLRQYPDRLVKAGAGAHSTHHKLLGQPGEDVTIQVPPGVVVTLDETPAQSKTNKNKDDSSNAQQQTESKHSSDPSAIADLTETGDRVLVAKGGAGGNPKNMFNGRQGARRFITLYLKLIADIGFVGFPNAGKSTLLRALSRAKPKVANYPFTTIRPNVGAIEYPDFRQITCADLPGLIEGAHRNFGLGHSFLRHVERTKLLLFIVDIQGFRLNERSPERSAFETVMSLNKELELYRADLITKPAVLVVNKLDTENAEEKYESFLENMNSQDAFDQLPDEIKPTARIDFKQTVGIVARDAENIEVLKHKLRLYLDEVYEESRAEGDSQKTVIMPTELNRQLV